MKIRNLVTIQQIIPIILNQIRKLTAPTKIHQIFLTPQTQLKLQIQTKILKLQKNAKILKFNQSQEISQEKNHYKNG